MKKLLIISLVLVFFGVLFSAIGSGSLSTEAKQGWAFFLNTESNWNAIEPALIEYLEKQGVEYNLQRIESSAERKAKIEQIRLALRGATNEQINAALAALGL